MPTLRLMTYNVRSMRDDRVALGRVISSADPDVVLIQEAPRFLRWRALAAELARRAGLVVVAGGRPARGNLILSSLGVDVVTTAAVQFSHDPHLHHRATSIAVLSLDGVRFAVAGTHLDLRPEPRLRHVAELHAAIAANVAPEVPSMIGGDMNDLPGSPVWQALVADRVDAWAAVGTGDGFTSSAIQPHQRIDAIFADPRVRVRSARVVNHPDAAVATDHLPLLVELDL